MAGQNDWVEMNLGTAHGLFNSIENKSDFEVGVFFSDDVLLGNPVPYNEYRSFGTLNTFPQFDLTVKIRRRTT